MAATLPQNQSAHVVLGILIRPVGPVLLKDHSMPGDGEIRTCAFQLWNMRGRPHGYEVEFWLQAERELRGEQTGEPVLSDGDFVTSGSGSDCDH